MGKKSEARERVKAMREEQAKAERRRERMMRFGVIGAVLVAVVVIVVAVVLTRGGDDGPAALPTGVEEKGGGITVGEADAPVTIDSWVDFLCPHCKEFEDANAATIDELVASGQAKVVYHPLTFTGAAYSTRANNAFACATDEGKQAEFFKAAFENPQQWSEKQLLDLGEDVGIGGDYESCVKNDTYNDWSSDVRDTATEAEISGTPTIFINGKELPNSAWNPEGIKKAVADVAAAAETPASTETPAPTATGTP